jgi:hypothetical protein
MGLMDDLAAIKSPKVCGTAKILDQMTEEDRADLVQALASVYPTSQIAALLRKKNYPISNDQLQYHRRGSCKCQSPTT